MLLRDESGLQTIHHDMERLCLSIGNRLAGSDGDRQAAEYVAERFRELGMQNVELLPFSCTRWIPGMCELFVEAEPAHCVRCCAHSHSPSTPKEGVEGEVVIFEPVDWEMGIPRADLEGKIGLFLGGYGESAARFADLHSCGLAGLIFVDARYQTDWPIANGVGEKFMGLMRIPMANMSLMDAYDLVRHGTKRAKLTCVGERRPGTSWNVSGEYPGTGPRSDIIVLCAHLDSVSVGAGADDDASGIAAILECARRLREVDGKYTLRFIGFGAEEQLSVGSTRYVTEQAKDLDRIRFVFNFDSIAAWFGMSKVTVTGTQALEQYIKSQVVTRQSFGAVKSDVSPYQDQFPFARFGTPGIWYTRETHQGGYWYHHSEYNNLESVSVKQIALTAESACQIAGDLLMNERWVFPRRISADLKKKVDHYTRELFE